MNAYWSKWANCILLSFPIIPCRSHNYLFLVAHVFHLYRSYNNWFILLDYYIFQRNIMTVQFSSVYFFGGRKGTNNDIGSILNFVENKLFFLNIIKSIKCRFYRENLPSQKSHFLSEHELFIRKWFFYPNMNLKKIGKFKLYARK